MKHCINEGYNMQEHTHKQILTLELEGRKLRYILKFVDMMEASEREDRYLDEKEVIKIQQVVAQIEEIIDKCPLY